MLPLMLILGTFDNFFMQLFGMQDNFSLIILGVKLVILLFIVSFVRNRFGAGVIPTLLTLGLAYIILFHSWALFGPLMLIYLFIVFGFTAILFDLSIAKPWSGRGEGENPQDSRDFQKRMRGGM